MTSKAQKLENAHDAYIIATLTGTKKQSKRALNLWKKFNDNQ